jgi:hypothetical protein
MNYKVILSMAIIPLLLIAAGGTVFGDTSEASTSSSGNYTFSANATMSTLTNLSYQSDNGNLLLASHVLASSGSATKIGYTFTQYAIKLDNATILKNGQENVFLMLSNYMDSYQNYTMNPKGTLSTVKMDLNMQMQDTMENMSMSVGLGTSFNSTVYSFIYNETEFYVFSNGQSVMSGSSISFHSTGYLLTGIISFGGLVNSVDNYKYVKENSFTYNSATGNVSGKYASFNLNASTGVISSFRENIINQTIFNTVYVTGNGSLFTQSQFPSMPESTPILLGSLFVYGNSTTVIAVHDNPAIESNFILDNGTLHLTLAPGLNATKVTTLGTDMNMSADVADNINMTDKEALDLSGSVEAGSHAILILGNGVRAYLLIHNASANISGSTVTINSKGLSQVSLVAPPGLQGKNLMVDSLIQKAIDNGRIAAEISISGSSSASVNVSITFNSTVRTVITSVSNGKVTLNVSAAAGHHEGTNVLIFISNTVIANGSSIHLSFDGNAVSLTSVNGVINATSTIDASFAVMKVSGGSLIILHVPHFSNHTVEIYSGSATTSPLGVLSQNMDLVVLGAVIAIIAVLSAVAVRMKKAKQ